MPSSKNKKRRFTNSRVFFAVMCFWGITCMDSLRINPSLAITAMAVSSHKQENTSRDQNNSTVVCNRVESTAEDVALQPEFTWSSKTQEFILSAFFIGLPLTQLPGGWLSDRVGGKWVMTIGAAITAIMNMLVPVAARAGSEYFFIVRLLAGLAEGTVVPAMFTLIGKWSTVDTNTRISSFAMAGAPFGLAFGQTLSGLICSTPWLGWPFSFYILGTLALIWVVIWGIFVQEQPGETIGSLNGPIQREDVQNPTHDNTHKKQSFPICKMLTSPPVFALIILRFSIQGWVVGTLLTNLPIFMKYVLGFTVREVGFLASIPYICLALTVIMTSHISDYLIGRGASVTKVRKATSDIGAVLITGSLIPVAFLACNRYYGLVLVITANIGIGIAYPSVFSNTVDLAPRLTGTLYGISNTLGMQASFISPLVTGVLIVDQYDPLGWRNVFYIASGIAAFAAILFHLFGSGEDQQWARDEDVKMSLKEDGIYPMYNPDAGTETEHSLESVDHNN